MNQIKIGKFISQLRHEKNFTQEELGEKLGVTNKTVSRWENGHYLPDIEIFIMLSDIFNISINELLSGEKISNQNDFQKMADENIINIAKESVFSFREKYNFWRNKWLKEHIFLIVISVILMIILMLFLIIGNVNWATALYPIVCLCVYLSIRNKMLIYIEHNIYD